MDAAPLVTVVMAAYNRSNVLRCAIESVRRSSFTDWELLVVDDASTDDTEAVVRSFEDDPRIRYIGLPENSGDQAVPNNEGCRLARGQYVAFLNHDDLWFDDHLAKALEILEQGDTDWVFSPGFVIYDEDDIRLHGVTESGRYDPRSYAGKDIPGCFWLVKREVLNELGGWHKHGDELLAPSQELLIRGFRAGKRIVMVPAITAIHFPTSASSRKDCYLRRDESEQVEYLGRMATEDRLRETLLMKALIGAEKRLARESHNVRTKLGALGVALMWQVGLWFGILPIQVTYFLAYRKKGGFVDTVNRNRGLTRS